LRDTRPFRSEYRAYLQSIKSPLSKTVGEATGGGFELAFALFLDQAPDVQSFAKNYVAIGFRIDYVKANGDLPNYAPDFIAHDTDGIVWIIETRVAKNSTCGFCTSIRRASRGTNRPPWQRLLAASSNTRPEPSFFWPDKLD
jgi:hypothetical protein